jgi:hypothetical protein
MALSKLADLKGVILSKTLALEMPASVSGEVKIIEHFTRIE